MSMYLSKFYCETKINYVIIQNLLIMGKLQIDSMIICYLKY